MYYHNSIIIVALYAILFAACGNENRQATENNAPASKAWLGKWTRTTYANGAGLEITSIDKDSIVFTIGASSGGNTGEMEGKTAVVGNKAKFYMIENEDTCILEFELMGDSIGVDQLKGNCGAAMGVYYSGIYYSDRIAASKENEENLHTLGLLDSAADRLFRELVKEDYDLFVSSSQMTNEPEADMDSLHARVYASGVRGLYTQMENIIILDSAKGIWAAAISGDSVFYYTNRPQYADKLPMTIEKWREKFSDKTVIFKNK